MSQQREVVKATMTEENRFFSRKPSWYENGDNGNGEETEPDLSDLPVFMGGTTSGRKKLYLFPESKSDNFFSTEPNNPEENSEDALVPLK